jgi:hypothetical protein
MFSTQAINPEAPVKIDYTHPVSGTRVTKIVTERYAGSLQRAFGSRTKITITEV